MTVDGLKLNSAFRRIINNLKPCYVTKLPSPLRLVPTPPSLIPSHPTPFYHHVLTVDSSQKWVLITIDYLPNYKSFLAPNKRMSRQNYG